MKQKAPFIIPVKLTLILMAITMALTVAGLTTLEHSPQNAAQAQSASPQPEIAHGDRFMPRILMQRAQLMYDAATQGDAGTVQRMTHPEDRARCSAQGLLTAVLNMDSNGQTLAADTPQHARWNVHQAQVWYGDEQGITLANIQNQEPGGEEPPSRKLVWSRTGSTAWRALPGCGDHPGHRFRTGE